MLRNYLIEVKEFKYFVGGLSLVVFFSYSVYIFCSDKMIIRFNDENQFFELGTAILFLVNSFIFYNLFRRKKNAYFLILAVLMFLGAAEELSWGQVLLNYKTPENLKSVNVQGEFNLHNIEIFNSNNFNKTHKTGLSRLLEINFIFRFFIIFYGVLTPILFNQSKNVQKIILKNKIPVPPLSIGMFFLISWLVLQSLMIFLPKGKDERYYFSSVEIFEFLTSYVFLNIAIVHFYFYSKLSNQTT